MKITEINWNQASELGLIERINTEILHPLGLAISRNPDTGFSESLYISDDGPCSGKKNVINRNTGIRQQILSSDFDSTVHINLGDTRQYFRCRNKLTTKEKNISIYEWDTARDSYDIIDQSQFIKAATFAKGK